MSPSLEIIIQMREFVLESLYLDRAHFLKIIDQWGINLAPLVFLFLSFDVLDDLSGGFASAG